MEFKIVDSKICSRGDVVISQIWTRHTYSYVAFGMHSHGLKTFAFHFLITCCDTSIIWLRLHIIPLLHLVPVSFVFPWPRGGQKLSKRCYSKPWGGLCTVARFFFVQNQIQLVRCYYGGRTAAAYRVDFQISGERDEPDAYAGHVTQTRIPGM